MGSVFNLLAARSITTLTLLTFIYNHASPCTVYIKRYFILNIVTSIYFDLSIRLAK